MDNQVLFSVDEETFARFQQSLDAPPSPAAQEGLERLLAVKPPWNVDD